MLNYLSKGISCKFIVKESIYLKYPNSWFINSHMNFPTQSSYKLVWISNMLSSCISEETTFVKICRKHDSIIWYFFFNSCLNFFFIFVYVALPQFSFHVCLFLLCMLPTYTVNLCLTEYGFFLAFIENK